MDGERGNGLGGTLAIPLEDASAWIEELIPSARTKQAAPRDGLFVRLGAGDQISGFQATGTSRYFVPSFSTCPIEGKVKWKPTTVAFSAAAMS